MKDALLLEDMENIFARNIPWEKLKNQSVLITGAYGMLASYVVYMCIYLNEYKKMNISLVVLVRSEEKFRKRFSKYADASYIKIYEDLLENSLEIEEEIDYIIHAASYASPQYYSVCPADVIKPNVIGSYYLLELAAKRQIKGFLLFSTGDIYGEIRGRDCIYESDRGTLDTLDIHSCYSESKRMAETMCCAYFRQYGVPVKILRIWHTYAPTMDVENDPRVFASFVKDIVHGKDIVMKSDGTGRRSFCYIADAVAGYFTVLLKGNAGEAYNVCNTGEYLKIRELAEILVTLRTDVRLSVITEKRKTDECYTENTSIGDAAPSDEKLRGLGWEPQYSVREGFHRVIESVMCSQ